MIRLPTAAPLLLIDTREQKPLDFPGWKTAVVGLQEGDYGLRGFSGDPLPNGSLGRLGIVVERKSIADLLGSVTHGRGRFLREIDRLRRYQFAAVVIDGTPEDVDVEIAMAHRRVSPASVFGTLDAIQVRAGIHIHWGRNREGSAQQIAAWFRLFADGMRQDFRALAFPPGFGDGASEEELDDVAAAAAEVSA